ncbi:hypothetical protein O0L34_g15506 [Tuta absoluta]|nr:hypothetical protein O0L34_g15506 [Tuta absoluta]
MPKIGVLYCKGMTMSRSESEADISEEKWDDEQLNAAYDKALKLANVEVAKRIAMTTNSSGNKKESKDKSRKPSKKHGSKKVHWSSGMPCRAVYEDDGLEYEAFVLQILNDQECIVKFLGYDNSEKVDMDTMKPSLGKEAQQRQIEQAMLDKGEESDGSMPPGTDREMQTDRGESPDSNPRSSHKKGTKKKKRNNPLMNGFQFPEVPMPDLNKLKNMVSMGIPMPPPVPFLGAGRVDCEEQAVSSMLISWYMSGYYTGLYQGLKRSKLNKTGKD